MHTEFLQKDYIYKEYQYALLMEDIFFNGFVDIAEGVVCLYDVYTVDNGSQNYEKKSGELYSIELNAT